MTKETDAGAAVKCIVDVLLGSDLNDDVKMKLEELKVNLPENTILRIIWGFYRYPLKALSFFYWLRENMDYTHNAVTYNGILRVLGQEKSIKEFWSMIKEMKSAGHELDIDTYIKISRQFKRSMRMEDSVELYEMMMDGPYKPPSLTCSVLLRDISMIDTPDINLVFRVVKKYEATGHALSKAAYDWIFRSLTSVGKLCEAEKILDTMRNAGFEPDNVTYSHGVLGLCKAGRLEEAIRILDEMEFKGCHPDMKTWTFIIREHCRAGEIDQALTCFNKMLEKNFDVDADLLEVLANGLYSKGRVDNAYALVIECVDKDNFRPSLFTYKNLIQKLLGERKLEEALNLLRLMKKQNLQPFRAPYVDYISKSGTVDDAREFFEALSLKQYLSYYAYLHVLHSFFKEGRQSEARDLLDKCPHHIRNHADILNLFASLEPGNATA